MKNFNSQSRFPRKTLFGNKRAFGDSGDGRSEKFPATCSKCGKECQVPFRPTNGKPVYCSDCFERVEKNNDRNDRGERRSFNNRDDRSFSEERRSFDATCATCGKKCTVPFRPTNGKPVYCSDCFERGQKWTETSPPQSQPQNKELKSIQAKLDKILELLQPLEEITDHEKVEPEAETQQ